MARTKRTKKFYKKSKWSANIQEFSSVQPVPQGTFFLESTMATNPTQNVLGVSQIYTVKNPELSFVLKALSNTMASYLDNIAIYIMYVPQGMTVTTDYNLEHPEYIMAYKFYGTPYADQAGQDFSCMKIKSRLSRKLNTGDKIILFVKGSNSYTGSNDNNLHLHGLTRWWTKAN